MDDLMNDDSYEEIYDTIKGYEKNIAYVDCPVCNKKDSMKLVNNCFYCKHCNSVYDPIIIFEGLAHGTLYDNTDLLYDYDVAYDIFGNEVSCFYEQTGCNGKYKKINGMYKCNRCGHVMTEDEFNKYIGSN